MLFKHGHPTQAKNVNAEQYEALSGVLSELKILLSECEEYKDEIPLPRFLSSASISKVRAVAIPVGRKDTDQALPDDYTKLTSMVSFVQEDQRGCL